MEEIGWAVLFLTPCAAMDIGCKRIGAAVLLAGALGAAGLAAARLAEGRTGLWEIGISLLPGLLLWGCSLLTQGKVGRGDGDMVLILGLMLGWRKTAAALCAACLVSALWAGAGLAAGRLKRDSALPFAPFLLAAAVTVGLAGG